MQAVDTLISFRDGRLPLVPLGGKAYRMVFGSTKAVFSALAESYLQGILQPQKNLLVIYQLQHAKGTKKLQGKKSVELHCGATA